MLCKPFVFRYEFFIKKEAEENSLRMSGISPDLKSSLLGFIDRKPPTRWFKFFRLPMGKRKADFLDWECTPSRNLLSRTNGLRAKLYRPGRSKGQPTPVNFGKNNKLYHIFI